MATNDEIAHLRLVIEEPTNAEPYTDDFLAGLIDSKGEDAAAADIWRIKANQVAKLVDISEGGSTRKMGDLYAKYDKIASSYEDKGNTDGSEYHRPISRKIQRV